LHLINIERKTEQMVNQESGSEQSMTKCIVYHSNVLQKVVV